MSQTHSSHFLAPPSSSSAAGPSSSHPPGHRHSPLQWHLPEHIDRAGPLLFPPSTQLQSLETSTPSSFALAATPSLVLSPQSNVLNASMASRDRSPHRLEEMAGRAEEEEGGDDATGESEALLSSSRRHTRRAGTTPGGARDGRRQRSPYATLQEPLTPALHGTQRLSERSSPVPPHQPHVGETEDGTATHSAAPSGSLPSYEERGSPDATSGWNGLWDIFRSFVVRVMETPLLRLLWVLFLVLLLLTGSAAQVVFLNYWLRQFPAGGAPGSYTTFAVSGVIFALFFSVAFVLYVVLRRPDLRFAKESYGWKLLFFIALMDTVNSGMAMYAALYTSEVLQALFTSFVPIYAAVFTKWFLKDPRHYCNGWILCSFSLIVVGIVVASISNLDASGEGDEPGGHSNDTSSSSSAGSGGVGRYFGVSSFASTSEHTVSASDRRWWSLIFFLSVPPTVLLNIGQTLYMTCYTKDDELDAKVAERLQERGLLADSVDFFEEAFTPSQAAQQHRDGSAPHTATFTAPSRSHGRENVSFSPTNSPPSPLNALGSAMLPGTAPRNDDAAAAPDTAAARLSRQSQHYQGEDTAVKLVLLAVGTVGQSLMTFVALPVDALPFFGSSSSVPEAWDNFIEGVACVLHCPGNLLFCVLYSFSFVLVYIGAAYLNQYSVTLCSMVSQLAGPITALVLIIFPQLNLSGDVSPWYVSLTAVALLSAGTFVYVVWDEMTDEEKLEGEIDLRIRLMGLDGAGTDHHHHHHHRPPTEEYVLIINDGETPAPR